MSEKRGTLKIWIGINSLHGRPAYKTIEIVHDVTEHAARDCFKVWQSNNDHLPHACAKWVPDVVNLR